MHAPSANPNTLLRIEAEQETHVATGRMLQPVAIVLPARKRAYGQGLPLKS